MRIALLLLFSFHLAAADGSNSHKTWLVVPCYNEALRLPSKTFETYLGSHPKTQLIMVNDGSSDGTLDMLRDLRTQKPDQVTILNLEGNRGKAEATRLGMLAALNQVVRTFGTGRDVVGFWDAGECLYLLRAPSALQFET